MKRKIDLTKENVEKYCILSGVDKDGWTHKAAYRTNGDDIQGIFIQSFAADKSAGGIAEIPLETFLQNYQDVEWYVNT